MKQIVASLVFAAVALFGFSAGAQTSLSAEPHFPLESWQRRGDANAQKFNGEFVKRLTSVFPVSVLPCLTKLANQGAPIRVETYASGELRSDVDAKSCSNQPMPNTGQVITDRVSISGDRLAALALVVERFEHEPFFAGNNRDLSLYDFTISVSKGIAAINLDPGPQHSTIAGCPKTGTVNATYFVNLKTYTVQLGRMVC